MARYNVQMNRTADTTLPVGSVGADATRPRRGVFYDLTIGSEAAAADNPYLYTVQRVTALGTSTAVTPQALDPGDAATEADAGENHTVNATATANAILLTVPLNQRATFRWTTQPENGLIYPATASNGLAVYTPTASAVAITVGVHFSEM